MVSAISQMSVSDVSFSNYSISKTNSNDALDAFSDILNTNESEESSNEEDDEIDPRDLNKDGTVSGNEMYIYELMHSGASLGQEAKQNAQDSISYWLSSSVNSLSGAMNSYAL